ncbi:hypothetical protein [Burkholderia cepacia]|uniref:hypothetical protein n=2 Tax=Burkholderia cepacia TaxID=292 RepID=UPI0010FD7A02|nr:hypothetical protein [Burkholderia cepacia]MBY4804901.1 hypothetical protein [Burkholderia cepacia]MCA7893093.1 hypothetical protein [Burkholderia cepacia]MCA8333305.1 hypothetical protein [Burkholderia cepacia]MCA8471009.1 hypothetical protein [Burkholderia cepacia]MDN7637066.1 hypothetical protein [Burkholderia cepacia]
MKYHFRQMNRANIGRDYEKHPDGFFLRCLTHHHSIARGPMLIGHAVDFSPEVIRAALPIARRLFDEQWLVEQAGKNSSDPLLYTEMPLASARGSARALREGIPQKDEMHPLAEAVIGTERILKYHDERGEFLCGVFAYRLLSLRDVALNLDNVKNMKDRLPRLTGDQWQSALYELLVASAQANSGKVELLDEVGQAVPDMAIDGSIFIECKAKTQYEEKVSDFIGRFRRLALDKIFEEAAKIGDGLLIKIDVHDEAGITDIPHLLRSMFADKLTRRSTHRVKINVTPHPSGPFELPHPMKAHSAELWRWIMNFDEWRDWHFVLPFGELIVQNASNVMVTSVRRPILVCARSTALSKSVQNIRATVANACRRQLRDHQPGMVRVLVNSDLYGIGQNSNAATIKDALDELSMELLRTYTRLVGVRFDIVTPPDRGDLAVHYTSAGAVRQTVDKTFESIISTPGVLLL